MPGHLDGFQFAFVRGFGIAGEVGQFGDVAVQVGEADRERIEFGMSFGEQDADVFGVVPGECLAASVALSVRQLASVVLFRNVVSVPGGNLDDDFAGLGDLRLAAETRV